MATKPTLKPGEIFEFNQAIDSPEKINNWQPEKLKNFSSWLIQEKASETEKVKGVVPKLLEKIQDKDIKTNLKTTFSAVLVHPINKLSQSVDTGKTQEVLEFKAALEEPKEKIKGWDTDKCARCAEWLLSSEENPKNPQGLIKGLEKSDISDDLKGKLKAKFPSNSNRILTRKSDSVSNLANKNVREQRRKGTANAQLLDAALQPVIDRVIGKAPLDGANKDSPEILFQAASFLVRKYSGDGSTDARKEYEDYFSNLETEKFSPEQKEGLTKARLEKEFGEVEAPQTMEKAKEIAEAHFSDAVGTAEFAGKQRVLHSLVAQKDEGLLGEIGTLMQELRALQKKYYTENYYIGQRQIKEQVEGATEEDAKLFGTDARSLKVHRALGKSIVGVEWNDEACKELTADELSTILQGNPEGEFNTRILDQVIAGGHLALYDKYYAEASHEHFTEEQKQAITAARLKKEFGDIGALNSMAKAHEIASTHFSDAVVTEEFAGKQRVLHSLVAQKDEGLLGVIGTLMQELRELQRTYYTESYYIGKRVNAKIEAATEKDVSFFKNDLLGLQVRRLLKQPIVGVEWNEAACAALTPEELRVILENKPIEEFNAYMLNGENDASVESTEKEPGTILQAKLEGGFKNRIVAQVIKYKCVDLRGLIEWEDIDLETRQKAKNALFANETNPENYRPLAQGLDTEGVQKVFGTGKLSAYVHTELKLPQEKVKWEGDAYEALEGEAYVQFLLQQSKEWDKLEANMRGTLAKKRPELQARIFVAYKGKISENIDWSKNEALTLAMKKQCAESYANYGLFPQQLKQVFTTEEIAEEFEFVIQKTWGNAEQLQKMNWAKASKEQRQKGLARVKQLTPSHTEIQYGAFAEGLNSKQIIENFGTGIDAAKIHQDKKLSLDDIKWDNTVVGILEGEVLLKWLNTHGNLSNELERFLSVTNNHGLIPKLNDPLKKDAVAYFCDHPKLKPPECLKGHCTTAQYRQLFGYSVWEKLGAFLLVLAGIFGLYHLYQRRKKS